MENQKEHRNIEWCAGVNLWHIVNKSVTTKGLSLKEFFLQM